MTTQAFPWVDEEANVIAWQLQCMLDLGMPLKLAERLVDAGADHHEVARLLKAGCPVGIVEEILL